MDRIIGRGEVLRRGGRGGSWQGSKRAPSTTLCEDVIMYCMYVPGFLSVLLILIAATVDSKWR